MNRSKRYLYRYFTLAAACALMGFDCDSQDAGVNPVDALLSWQFSGNVIDAYDQKPLAGATISYIDQDGAMRKTVCGSDGSFAIGELPPGLMTFTIAADTANKKATRYTTRRLSLTSGAVEDSAVLPVDISMPVPLYPLTGAIEGNLNYREPLFGKKAPAANVSVTLGYLGAGMLQCSPSMFHTRTDSTGAFSLRNLPVADSVLIECAPAVFDSVSYAIEAFAAPRLIPGEAVALGALHMLPLDTSAAKLHFVYSNVVDIATGRTAAQFGVNDTIRFIANRSFDTAQVRLVHESAPLPTDIVAAAETLLVIPRKPLRPGHSYTLFASISLASGLSHSVNPQTGSITFSVEPDPIRIVASNVLSPDGIGLSNVAINTRPYFVLSHTPDSADLHISFIGGGAPPAQTAVRGDTAFAQPVRNFAPGALVGVRIVGTDVGGEKIDIVLEGERVFTTLPTERYVAASNVLTVNQEGVREAAVTIQPWFVLSFPFDTSSLTVTYTGGGSPAARLVVSNDTIHTAPLVPFTNGASVATLITGLDANGSAFSVALRESQAFTTVVADISILASNVFTKYGDGKRDVSSEIEPWFVLSAQLDSETVKLLFSGGGSPEARLTFSGDTVFAHPREPFAFGSTVGFAVTGRDLAGNLVAITTPDNQKFHIEQALYMRESNLAVASNSTASLTPLDTFWVRYSEPLDSSTDSIEWLAPGIANPIYGGGENKNADCWINDDTLFLIIGTSFISKITETAGFRIRVQTRAGKQSLAQTFFCTLAKPDIEIVWTNTKDDFGIVREDFDYRDSVMLVCNYPVREITGVKAKPGRTPPEGISLEDFSFRGDTIIYVPALALQPNFRYGFIVNALFENGIRTDPDGLAAEWTTKPGVSIVQVDNVENGRFRALSAWGDSIRVRFSEPIDTSSSATPPFTIYARKADNTLCRATAAAWDSLLKTATIRFLDTLPTADYRASPAYSAAANNTRAITAVTFDLVTLDGEQRWGLGPEQGAIQLHTEPGICLIDANFVEGHFSGLPVAPSEPANTDLPKGEALTLRFNRLLDTAEINSRGIDKFISATDVSGYAIPLDGEIDSNGLGLKIMFRGANQYTNRFYIAMRDLPAAGIAGAAAINRHSGRASGESPSHRIIQSPVSFRTPDITSLRVEMISPFAINLRGDTIRLGCSAGQVYNDILGATSCARESWIPLVFKACAWNQLYTDSVYAYEVQVRKVMRNGAESGWYVLKNQLNAGTYSPGYSQIMLRSVDLTSETAVNRLRTADQDGATGYFFRNGSSLFNDSSRIQFRMRPVVGEGDPLKGQVGAWSNAIEYVDNVAPCDRDFVTGVYCDYLYFGGVSASEYNCTFDNSLRDTLKNGYIAITFPEDMQTGEATPEVTFYYGAFSDTLTDSITGPIAVNTAASGWFNAREYRAYLLIPPGDYSDNNSGAGAFYNVSVAGCKDAAGNAIQSYGSDGEQAVPDPSGANRINASLVTDHIPGSRSIIEGFKRCR